MSRPLRAAVRLYLTLAVPVLLTIVSVRLVMTPLFLQFEYTRPGFPEDPYGFTTDQRLEHAPHALHYLINNEPISFLADRELPGPQCQPPRNAPCPMYNERELRHMEDVHGVTYGAFVTALFGVPLTLALAFWLWRRPDGREVLHWGLFQGGILTLASIALILFTAVVAWDVFFDTFHGVFFEPGTWRFYYSDTLIRLFPEQFWFDASVLVGALTGGVALLMVFTVRPRRRKGAPTGDVIEVSETTPRESV